MGGMTLADVAWIVSEPGRSWAFDHFSTREAAQDCADRHELKTGERLLVEDFDTFHKRTTRELLEGSPLVEITADFYEEQHGCLPPMYRQSAWGWFMREFTSGSLTHQYVTHRGRYYTALVDMADCATWITPDKVEAIPDGSPVYAWFGAVALAPREMVEGDLTRALDYHEARKVRRWFYDRLRPAEPAARVAYLGDLMQWGEPLALGARLEGF